MKTLRTLTAITIVGLLLVSSSSGAQRLAFIAGPGGVIEEPTIPRPPVVNGAAIAGPFISRAVDLQGLGRADLIVGMGVTPTQPLRQAFPLRVLRPNAAGTALTDVTRQLLGTGTLPANEHPREIVAADFNRDGRLDVLVAAHGYDAAPHDGERNTLLLSRADGTLENASSRLPVAADFSHCAATGDVDGDGFQDIYVGNVTGRPGPYLLLGRASGGFDAVTHTLPDEVLTPGAVNRFHACLLVDADGDGALDLVLGSGYNNDQPSLQALLYLNDGKGDFTQRPRRQLPLGPFGTVATIDDIVAMDVNEDGRTDLLVLSTQSGSKQDVGMAVQVLLNHGNGTFVDETAQRLGASASRTNGRFWTFLHVADLDGDGRLDIYASGYPEPNLRVPIIWLNDGDGTFTAVDNDIFPHEVQSLEALDVDGDGQLDFVAVFVTPDGAFHYRTWLNRTQRSARTPKAVVEFHNALLDHYFITWLPAEIALLDAGTAIRGWSRTGRTFGTFAGPASESTDICRIYIVPDKGDSHFFGRGAKECGDTMTAHPDFVLEDAGFMAMRLPTAGACPFGTTPVYRVFSNRADANHRYTTDRAVRAQMLAKGWLAEGDGPDLVVMCAAW